MKFKRILTAALAALMICACAVGANASATPVYGGKAVFKAEDFKLDYDSVNGNGAFKAYRIDMEVTKLDGKDVVKLTAQDNASQPLVDFSYYQYNNSEYLPALKTTDYRYFAVRYKRAAATTASFTFWKANEAELGKTDKNANYPFKADSTDWETIVIDLNAQSALDWTSKNIRQFRLYPWGMVAANTVKGQTIYIEYFGFFKTEADVKAYENPAPAAAAKTGVTTAAKTADPFTLTAAVLAAAAVVVCKKKNH